MAELAIQRQVSLASLNTMAIPAIASYFAEVSNLRDASLAIQYAHQHQLPIFVVGEGSNSLCAADFDGLVILNRIKGISVLTEDQHSIKLRVAAGENWHDFVEYCLQAGWHGVENLALIPGLVGAAPIQNIGAYGVEVAAVIESVAYLDLETLEEHRLHNFDCQFGYRDSIFKAELKDRTLITAVDFELDKSFSPVVHYPSLAKHLDSTATAQMVFDQVCAIRRDKLPDPYEIPNSGSFFKNPIVSPAELGKLSAQFPDIVHFPFQDEYKIAAAWLIDQAGWKDKALSGVVVHSDQALVITNSTKRAGAVVLEYAESIQADILAKYGIELEIEPRVVS
ncbi:MAG: UDP-N-acetylmuramate dehydrogenase [Pseudomonadota bacterium]